MGTTLTSNAVAEIKRDLSSGKLPQCRIAAKHGVSRSLISDIATGRAHKDVPWPDGVNPRKKAGGQHSRLPEYDPTNDRIQELESEVEHLTQERNWARARNKEDAKARGVISAMTSVLKEELQPLTPPPPHAKKSSGRAVSVEHCVMHLSDMHADQTVLPEECGGLENYNFRVACCRAERLVDSIIDWTQTTIGGNFKFPDLWVLSLGDHSSGEIHKAMERSYYRNQFKNCLAIGKLQYLMLRDLSQYFERVHVVCVPGNHGRRSIKKDYHGAHDNWDYLIAKVAQQYAAAHTNIDWLIPDAYSLNLEICGVGFHVSHGDDIRGWAGLPYYGLQRRQRNLVALDYLNAGPRVRYICTGHFHRPAVIGDMDTEIIVNGAWPATDSFAYNGLAGFSMPQQWFHGVNAKHGITWRMPIFLRDVEQEKAGPKRYKVEIE